ncbi:MAG: glycosyltransferase family 4 protein [Planctomycetaceae bacterium]
MTSRQQVVFCTHDSPASIGGPFTWLRRLLPELRAAGIDCRVLALTHFGRTGPLVQGLQSDGFDVQVTDCHDRTEDDVRWILTQLQTNVPQVFVPNFVVAACYAARWLKQAGAATVAVLHSDDAFYRAIQQEFMFGSEKFRLTDVVCVSEKLYQEVCALIQGLDLRAFYIPMGAQIPDAAERDYSKRLRIAYVGRLAEEQKRISLVVQALDQACAGVAGVEAVIYGDGPDRASVEHYLKHERPGSPVVLAGSIPAEAVQPALVQCDAIVLMSDYEGLPIALLEGMGCGCIPICRSMDSGIPQLVQHGQTGLLVSDQPADFVAAVRFLRQQPQLARTMSDNARQLIVDKYSHQYSCDCWIQLIRQHADRQPVALKMPRRLQLPAHQGALESADRRRPAEPQWRRSWRRLRIQLGGLRRRLFVRNPPKMHSHGQSPDSSNTPEPLDTP